MEEPSEHLKRNVGIIGLSANLMNIVIGAGIFALPAIVAAGLGSASIFAYLFCGVLVALVMLCFAEVGSKVTTSGGVYAYIQSAFGPYVGFLTVILFVLAAISADAAVANAIVDIIGSIFSFFQSRVIKIIFFLLVFAGLAYVNVVGIKQGMRLVKFFIIAKLIPLLLLVFISWGDIELNNLTIASAPSLLDIGKTSLILFFAFQGAEAALSISGEVRNPQKTIPWSILISIVSILILYILIQTVSQGVLGSSLSTFKENPLGAVASKVLGPIGFTLITVGAAVSMFGYLSSAVLSMPRVLYRASVDRVLPFNALEFVHKRFATPYISVISYAGLGFLFASLGGFEQLAIISSASILLVYLGVSLSVMKLRKGETLISKSSHFKIPGGYTVPILSCITILWLLSNLSQQEMIAIGIFIIVLTLIYLLKILSNNKMRP